MKLHSVFWLVQKSVTSNETMAVMLCYFAKLGGFMIQLRQTGYCQTTLFTTNM